MNYFNYSVSSKQGKFYLKSSEEKEGYEKVVFGTDNKVTYHKYFQSITGVVKSFDTKEIVYEGKTLKFLEVTLVEGDNSHKISVNLKNQKGGYTDEARMIISALKGLDKISEPVTFSLRKNTYKNARGEEKQSLNLYVNYVNILGDNGKGLSTGFIPFSEIPAPEKKEIAGDVTYDWTPQTVFFYEEFLKLKDRFSGASETPNTPTPTVVDENEDNLPF